MNEVPSLGSARAKPGSQAAEQTPVDASAEGPAGRRAFDDALDERGELHPQQTGATRTAIKRSLDRLEGSDGSQATQVTTAGVRTRAGEAPRSGTDMGDDHAPDTDASRLSGRRADRQPYGAVSRQEESDPGTGASVVEVAPGSKGRAAAPLGRGAVAGRPESPVTGRSALGEAAAERKGHAAEVYGREAGAEPQQSRDAGRSALGEVAVRRDAEGLPSARTPPDREPAERSARVVVVAKPVVLDGPQGAATDAPGIPGYEGLAPPSERGRGMERVSKPSTTPPEGRALNAAPTTREDGLPSGAPERGTHTDAVRNLSNTAGTTGRGPLRDDPDTGEAATHAVEGDTGEAATDAFEGDTGVDALDASPMRPADLEGLVPSVQRTVAAENVAPEAVRSSAQDIGQVAGQVADRILVSMPAPGAPEEVRITLRDSVLEGSDVRISREGGEIRIVFVAQTEAAQRLLADHRGVFEQTLGERLGEERVHVAVEGPDSGDTSRSEGDGRSRQQYVPEDDGRLGDIET